MLLIPSRKSTIIATFKLSDKEFNPIYKDIPNYLRVTAYSPKSTPFDTQILGYMQFDKKKEAIR